MAEEMSKLTDYQVTLQIPAANLSANRKVRALQEKSARKMYSSKFYKAADKPDILKNICEDPDVSQSIYSYEDSLSANITLYATILQQ